MVAKKSASKKAAKKVAKKSASKKVPKKAAKKVPRKAAKKSTSKKAPKKAAKKSAPKKVPKKAAKKSAPKKVPKKAARRPEQEPVDLGTLAASDVTPFLNQVFTVRSAAGDVRIRLISCEEHPAGTMPGAGRTAFSMILRSETDQLRLAGDGGYDLSLEGFGTLPSVLISPIVRPGGQSEGMFYQVCFG